MNWTKLNNIQHLFLMGVMNKTRACLVLWVRFRSAAKLHAWAVKYKQAGLNNSRISANWFSERYLTVFMSRQENKSSVSIITKVWENQDGQD